jgi:hypothetical protein
MPPQSLVLASLEGIDVGDTFVLLSDNPDVLRYCFNDMRNQGRHWR